jgi:hypothetical protein
MKLDYWPGNPRNVRKSRRNALTWPGHSKLPNDLPEDLPPRGR